MELDITDLSLFEKSIVYHLLSVSEEHPFDEEFFNGYIKNLILINDQLESKIRYLATNKVSDVVLRDSVKIYEIERDYNSPYILIQLCNEILNEIELALGVLEGMNVEELIDMYNRIHTSTIFINTGISSLNIARAQRDMCFSWDDKYMPGPIYIQAALNSYNTVRHSLYDYGYKISDLAFRAWCRADLLQFKYNYLYYQFQLTFLFILNSPFYSTECKVILDNMLKKLRKLMYNSSIYKIYFQKSDLTLLDRAVEERGLIDATTRIQVFFTCSNFDAYSLRIDLPHKGVPSFHYNLHEFNRETGFLLNREDVAFCRNYLSKAQYNELFFEYEERVMFRNDFETKLRDLQLKSEMEEMLAVFFKSKCHEEIDKLENESVFLESIECYQNVLNMITLYTSKDMTTKKLDINGILRESVELIQLSTLTLMNLYKGILADCSLAITEDKIQNRALGIYENSLLDEYFKDSACFDELLLKLVEYYVKLSEG